MTTTGNFQVSRKKGESDFSLITRFMRKQKKEDLIKEIKQRSSYEKPGDKKRRKRKEAIKRNIKDALKKELLDNDIGVSVEGIRNK